MSPSQSAYVYPVNSFRFQLSCIAAVTAEKEHCGPHLSGKSNGEAYNWPCRTD
jgi:hypothetical protein